MSSPNQNSKYFFRPKEAAAFLGISIASFWRLAKTDSSFPKRHKLLSNCSVVAAKELEAWVENKLNEVTEP